MPGGDRTGPIGMGSMTGRGAGYCAGYDVPGSAGPMGRRGLGRGTGRRWRCCAGGLPAGWSGRRRREMPDNRTPLEARRRQLESELAAIKQQLADGGGLTPPGRQS